MFKKKVEVVKKKTSILWFELLSLRPLKNTFCFFIQAGQDIQKQEVAYVSLFQTRTK